MGAINIIKLKALEEIKDCNGDVIGYRIKSSNGVVVDAMICDIINKLNNGMLITGLSISKDGELKFNGKVPERDLTGQRFGQWNVLWYENNMHWLCKCSCKNETIKSIATYSLISGKSKSCGCERKIINSNERLDDIKGNIYGEWTVLEYCGKSMWKCRCTCGNEKVVKAQSLKNGNSMSCGHGTTGFKDLTGMKFGELTVEKYIGDYKWLCLCSCGRKTAVNAQNLVRGDTKSCGHTKMKSYKLLDLTGQRFGKLTVIKYVGGNKWLCECSCGNKTIKYSHNLRRSNNTISCGCTENKALEKADILRLIKEYEIKNDDKPYASDLITLLNRSQTSVQRYIDRYSLRQYLNTSFRSKAEREIAEKFSGCETNNRGILDNNMELDLYYKDRNIAIEYNGIYWHSSIYKDKYYHVNKTKACMRKGITLIHIFEYEWNTADKKKKIIDLLARKLTNNITVVQGRKTQIRKIGKKEASQFLIKYHLQGAAKCSVALGCFTALGELIGVMTFGTPRFNNEYEYELIRLCWKSGIAVIGGVQKLFEQFKKEYNPKSIITYSDMAKFSGEVYKKLGFKLAKDSITEPNYVWVNANSNIVMSRYETMKHKLIERNLGEKEQTEDEIMSGLGFYKVYDCGNLKFIWNRKQSN